MKGLLVLVGFALLFGNCCCDLDSQRRRAQGLKSRLLKNYITTVAPSNRVQVNVSFTLISILALEEASQVFHFSASLTQQWYDSWLSWESTLGIKSLNFETNEIWTPNLFIPNGVGDTISNIPASLPARVNRDGAILLITITEFETICNVDVTKYPYDEQICQVELSTIFDAQLSLVSNQEVRDVFQSYFAGSTEWELLEVTRNINVPALKVIPSHITIEVRLRRHSIFYTLSVIFPMCLLSFLNSFVFLLPAASGEKISFLLSIFVSGAVFLNFINDAIPKSSQASRLTIYLVLLLSQSALALLATLLVMNIYHRQGALLCFFRKNRRVKDEVTPAWTEEASEQGNATEKLDKALFLLFFTMAAASVLVFYM